MSAPSPGSKRRGACGGRGMLPDAAAPGSTPSTSAAVRREPSTRPWLGAGSPAVLSGPGVVPALQPTCSRRVYLRRSSSRATPGGSTPTRRRACSSRGPGLQPIRRGSHVTAADRRRRPARAGRRRRPRRRPDSSLRRCRHPDMRTGWRRSAVFEVELAVGRGTRIRRVRPGRRLRQPSEWRLPRGRWSASVLAASVDRRLPPLTPASAGAAVRAAGGDAPER
jgi:hypothetical protein